MDTVETSEDIHATCSPSGFLWCLHCERTYRYGEYRKLPSGLPNGFVYQMCPYAGCDGDTFKDAWDWDVIREDHPDYPESPDKNVTYPMY